MKKLSTLIYFFLSFIFFNCENNNSLNQTTINKSFKEYNYFGKSIEDSYNNLENLNDTLVLKWLKNQTEYSNEIIKSINGRINIHTLENELRNKDETKIKYLKITPNNKYFYLKNTLLDNTYKLYYRNGFNNEEKILLNPSDLSSNKNASINYIQPNYDGSKILINLTESGAEIGSIYIFDVANNTILKDVIPNCWPSALGGATWLTDNNSFIYSHIPVIDSNSENFILNTASVLYSIEQNTKKKNVLLSKKNNPNLDIISGDFPIVSIRNQNEKYIFGRIAGARNYDDYYYAKYLSKSNIAWKPLYQKEDKVKEFIINNNDNLFFLTAQNASNYKIGKTSLVNPNFKNFETIIEEDSTAVITDMVVTSEGLFYVKTKNGVDARLYQLINKTIKEIPIPKQSGNINLISNGSNFKQLWIEIEGWTNDIERYKFSFEEGTFIRRDLFPSASNELADFVVKEIEIPSYDGTMVPLSIIHKKGLILNSKNRVFMTGYGAYGISDTPYLDKYMLHWVNNGGVYAISHTRGGGEKGDAWHKGGYKLTKPNTWKDFIACTEYLISEKYSSPDKIALWSASAGGILIGRAVTERPDLYAAAIIKVGILNTLRNEFAANGKNGIKEFGSVKDSLGFIGLLEMDSYHHIKKNTNYPAVFLTAGLKDSRLATWQSAKFAARLQESTTSNKPVLLSVDFEGGHGFDASENKQDKELTDVLAFALWQTGHPDYQPKK